MLLSPWHKLGLLLGVFFLFLVLFIPTSVSAQWPPFRFDMTPSYLDGKITYTLRFSKRIDTPLADVLFKIPLPEGTRFIEASAQPSTSVDFDGAEITFFTSVLHRPIRNASFVVEVIDPTQTEFTTHAWIAWKGEMPGDYLTDEVAFDITKTSLEWSRPRSRLELEAGAVVVDDVITYTIYPDNVGGRRMWDLQIKVPLPPGTTLLSTQAPPPFVADYDGQEVTFLITEMPEDVDVGPLTVQVSTTGVTEPFVVTHAWASWKNVGRSVSRRIDLQEDVRSGDLVVRPGRSQQVVADPIGDVPLSNYDVTSVALQGEDDALRMTFYGADEISPVGEPLEYIVYIDNDCNTATGASRRNIGAEYWVRYKHTIGKAAVYTWDETEAGWQDPQLIEVAQPAGGKVATMRMSYALAPINPQFCWLGRVRNRSEDFSTNLDNEWIGTDSRLTRYDLSLSSPDPILADHASLTSQPWGILASNTAAPAGRPAPLQGKLAIPLDNGQGFYDLHIFAVPDGSEIMQIPFARQPDFHPDGERVLVNREGGGTETIEEFTLADGIGRRVSDDAEDAHPFYDLWGNRVTYGNHELVVGADGNQQPFIYVQCGLRPPHEETDPRCHDLVSLGQLVPAGHRGELQGSHPVWTVDDRIVYRGCNSWNSFALCGIYIVPATSTKGFSDGFIPQRLTEDTSDTPTDTQDHWITLTSHRDGNWEAYVMDLNGAQLRNLSNSPTSNDGLPTISPDGDWVAFVSDRDGQWAVWAVPFSSGEPQKLFDLPTNTPWGDDERGWLNERISWGP